MFAHGNGHRLQIARVERNRDRIARRLVKGCARGESLGNKQRIRPLVSADTEIPAGNLPAVQESLVAIILDELQGVNLTHLAEPG